MRHSQPPSLGLVCARTYSGGGAVPARALDDGEEKKYTHPHLHRHAHARPHHKSYSEPGVHVRVQFFYEEGGCASDEKGCPCSFRAYKSPGSTCIAHACARVRMQKRGALKMKPKSAALDDGEDGEGEGGEDARAPARGFGSIWAISIDRRAAIDVDPMSVGYCSQGAFPFIFVDVRLISVSTSIISFCTSIPIDVHLHLHRRYEDASPEMSVRRRRRRGTASPGVVATVVFHERGEEGGAAAVRERGGDGCSWARWGARARWGTENPKRMGGARGDMHRLLTA
ncbi:hypothetical protein B0H13DRAFT_2384629 [Mycena leptocephala]|nr:hypothetical protein B0H13DRAFT_2384629 [Mycena leptocephala]